MCDSVQSWWLHSAALLEHQATYIMTRYPIQSHFPDAELTSHCPIPSNAETQTSYCQAYILVSYWLDSVRFWNPDLLRGKHVLLPIRSLCPVPSKQMLLSKLISIYGKNWRLLNSFWLHCCTMRHLHCVLLNCHSLSRCFFHAPDIPPMVDNTGHVEHKQCWGGNEVG